MVMLNHLGLFEGMPGGMLQGYVGVLLDLRHQIDNCMDYIPLSTVDGNNLAPPGMYKTLKIMGQTTYQLVQDFFH